MLCKVNEDGSLSEVASNGGGSADYSTEEVDTGVKWIDGKKIYRKCGFKASLPANIETILDTELKATYVGAVIGFGGSVKSQYGEYLPFTGYIPAVGTRIALVVSANGLKTLSNPEAATNANWWLEYTKATD